MENQIELFPQPTPLMSGQSCVVMILGCSIDDAVALIGHSGIATGKEIANAFAVDPNFIQGAPNRDVQFALQNHIGQNGFENWTVYFDGQTLDPAGNDKDRRGPVSKYLPLELRTIGSAPKQAVKQSGEKPLKLLTVVLLVVSFLLGLLLASFLMRLWN